MRSYMLGVALAALTLGSAHAADFNVKAQPVQYAGPQWTGFYAGLHAGYAGGDLSVVDINGGVVPGPFAYTTRGGIGGGQIGYNYAITNMFLVGLEGQVGYLGQTGQGRIGSANAVAHQDLTVDSGVLADITGRVGVTFGSLLIYGKGGGAWFNGQARQTTTNPGYVTTGTSTFTGWTAGGGVEYMISRDVSIKGEYQYYDFGSQAGFQTNVGDLSSPIGYNFNNVTSLKFNTAKLGLNYHF